ncbi:hypothetical protein [Komagataeibacter xylinus]|uniref:hypothetical protein n=1 Tax=Komagataeibacter xylinus TaxID=28448 RepID=UPI00280B1763|nr:hypothetical protein [Komagataeibacter xylinus]
MRSREEQINDLAVVMMDEGGKKEASYAFAQETIDAAIQRGRELERAEMFDVAVRVARDVAELPDRTSPDGNPDMMLVTAEELTEIVRRALGGVGDGHDSDCATHNEPAFPNGPCNCTKRDTERLDWLEKQRFPELRAFDDGFLVATDQVCRSSGMDTARDAIDAAMNAENCQ